MRRQLATLLRRLADRLEPPQRYGMFVRFDEPDANGVILKRKAFEKAAERLNDAVAERDAIKVRDLVFRRKDNDV